MERITIVESDITKLQVDAIVNAANISLLGGGGVDGAIHRSAGSQLLDECRRLSGCPTGEARITAGYDLPCNHVIHTVGPIWHGGEEGEDLLLASCYKQCFKLVADHKICTIAFPAISTGVYGFPKLRAAHIAVAEAQTALSCNGNIDMIYFCSFNKETSQAYENVLNNR